MAAVWAAAGVAHLWLAIDSSEADAVARLVAATLAAAAAGGAIALVIGRRPGALLAAAITGAVGVASFLAPLLLPVPGLGAPDRWLDPWAFGAFLLDGLTVRLAVFTLRRASRASD